MSRHTHKQAALQDFLEAAKQAALKAALVLADWRARFTVTEKARCDLVTEADLASQKTIQDFLLGRFPDHAFLGEEGTAADKRPNQDAPPTWIVDPIDGTTNYVHDCPLYCVSIGLLLAGELVVGVIYDPCRQEMFAGGRGLGAWLGSRRLHTSTTSQFGDALLSTGFPPDIQGQERALDWWRYFSLRARSLRRTGSTALNLAYVAAGRFDGYWGFDNHAWDVAAGTVLVREAGGVITNVDGSDFDPFTPDALGSNGPLHGLLLKALREGPKP
jgi:myo-inositol-1(or 4)-monophosphatase